VKEAPKVEITHKLGLKEFFLLFWGIFALLMRLV
jgi:hypothetical protein